MVLSNNQMIKPKMVLLNNQMKEKKMVLSNNQMWPLWLYQITKNTILVSSNNQKHNIGFIK